MPHYIALLRGINVGHAKPISMATLAAVFERLGYSDVTTVLRSGNVVFSARQVLPDTVAAEFEQAIFVATGVHSSVLLFEAKRFAAIARQNPLPDHVPASPLDGAKLFVTFVESMPADLSLPDAATLDPEMLAVGSDAVYQWMPEGSQQSAVPKSFWKQFSAPVTARNWNTVQKLVALSQQ